MQGATTGRNYRDVYVVDMMTGDRKLIKKQLRFPEGGSPDGTKWMYYEDKNFFVYDLATGVRAESHALATTGAACNDLALDASGKMIHVQ